MVENKKIQYEEEKDWEIQELEYCKQINQLNMRLKCANEWIRLYSQGKKIWDKCNQKCIKKIVVYGVSDLASMFIDFCFQENIHVVGISDSKITAEGMDYKGIPFIPLLNIKDKGEDITVVITAMGYVDEIRNALISNGIINIVSLLELVE